MACSAAALVRMDDMLFLGSHQTMKPIENQYLILSDGRCGRGALTQGAQSGRHHAVGPLGPRFHGIRAANKQTEAHHFDAIL